MTKISSSIVFLHGFPFNKSCWDQQISYLKSHYEIAAYAPDLRGHGVAISPPGPWMIAHFSDDLKNFLDQQKIEKAIICGLSMGGYIALHFANAYPDRLAGLILSDTRADSDSNEAKEKRYAAIRKIHEGGFKDFAHSFSTAALGETTLKEKPELQKKIEEIILSNKKENVSMTLGALASRSDSTANLEKISCSTLILVGSEDRVTPPEVNQAISKKIPSAQFFKIEKAGHLSNMEQPDQFNRYLKEYLDSEIK